MRSITDIAIDYLVRSVLDGLVDISADRKRELAKVSRDVELRWQVIGWRLIVRCPNCLAKMESDCARFTCYMCDEDYILRSRTLCKMCERCISYKEGRCTGPLGELDLERPVLVSRKTGKQIPAWVLGSSRLEEE